MSFKDLKVSPELIKQLLAAEINKPFPIQKATLPDAISGRDILGRGQTGSGKTLAFGLALLTRLSGRNAAPMRPLESLFKKRTVSKYCRVGPEVITMRAI